MTNKRKRWSAVIIIMISSAGFYAWSSDGQVKSLDQKPRQSGRISFGALTERVIATGVIRPMVGAEVNVGSRISGTVVSLPVEVGDKVVTSTIPAAVDGMEVRAITREQTS